VNSGSELLCNWWSVSQSVSQSVRFGLEPLCDTWPDFSCSQTITGLISGSLLESSSLDHLWSLYSTFCWSLLVRVSRSYFTTDGQLVSQSVSQFILVFWL